MPEPGPEPSPEFARAFQEKAGGGAIDFAAFVELALYHPVVGYYRRGRPRIGPGPGTDFVTASSVGRYFGQWVAAACVSLLAGRPSGPCRFFEIGAEPGGGILAGVENPFAGYEAIGVGGRREITGAAVVFSNELFDAQPFRRHVFRRGAWREIGVTLAGGRLRQVEWPAARPDPFPAEAPEGYVIDAPFASVSLLERMASPGWTGLFLAFDYGKSWDELAFSTPAGTARAYRRHRQSNELLAWPGEQDLTCHVCWDWLKAALVRQGFSAPVLESQEAFLVRHAAAALERVGSDPSPALDPAKRALARLIHPDHLGRRFQVLHATRW